VNNERGKDYGRQLSCFNFIVRFWHVPAEAGEYCIQQSIVSFWPRFDTGISETQSRNAACLSSTFGLTASCFCNEWVILCQSAKPLSNMNVYRNDCRNFFDVELLNVS
jgi:hypothetical protein